MKFKGLNLVTSTSTGLYFFNDEDTCYGGEFKAEPVSECGSPSSINSD